ncbi:hypothetical protein FEM48_Zijuj06G0162900 [Ziziphus jujuba var. spinosa]|uniref:Cytochrome P450 CYP736A12-like n=1 Tax=Ziziphus jujuba var. spinosa TaxID=714518 RepID=A0A978VAB7_ZIZJJ|nr:hypothetical protein FEM48_Zijuj06G0162900 [Ziziphus jujuba var. spinosa]
MVWIWFILSLVLVFLLQPWKNNKNKKLPPGPRGFPIFGSLHLLGEFPHRDLHQLAKHYGPIMHLRLGLVPTTVVSSPQAAELFLKTHDLVFATRPSHEAAKHISYDQKNLTFAKYGSYWRTIRKMCTLELLSILKIDSFRDMRKEELGLFIEFVREAARDQAAVDLSAKISSLSADMSCIMVFGKKYLDSEFDERGFKAVIQEGMHLAAVPNLGDYIPQIARFDFQGLTKKMKAVSKVFDDFFEKIIDEHIQSAGDEHKTSKDFVDVMLSFMGSEESEYRIERPNIKAIILESDLESLEYLNMVVKETLRLHPVAPLLLPHASMEDCTVEGFHIPKESHVIFNAWAIGRDPLAWTDPEKFFPERFEGSSVDLRRRYFQLIPFGSGRRGCPGIQLGLTVVRLVLAQLVHCFDWELPNGMLPTELDMTEEFGITTPRAKHLLAIPTYRLRK